MARFGRYKVMNYYGYELIRESDLTHHGIKGQKWGQRRFQNEDGTWTAAGKERYGDDDGSPRSFKGNIHRALAANYGLNAKVYSKSNKVLASMNKQAQNEQLKKAAAADQAKKDKLNARNEARLAKQNQKTAQKATMMAKIYEINEKTYTKLGNKTMASMNKAAKEEQLKIAASSIQTKNGKKVVSKLL